MPHDLTVAAVQGRELHNNIHMTHTCIDLAPRPAAGGVNLFHQAFRVASTHSPVVLAVEQVQGDGIGTDKIYRLGEGLIGRRGKQVPVGSFREGVKIIGPGQANKSLQAVLQITGAGQ